MNDFWTQYNRYFGTPKHLASEFHKSPNALNVKYKVKRGTEILTGQGICLSANESEIVLLGKGRFHHLNKVDYTIVEVLPEHTDLALHFRNFHFFNITVDSLNKLIQQQDIQQLEIYSNQEFIYYQHGISRKGQNLKLEYPENLFFQTPPDSIILDTSLFFPNPKILTIQLQIKEFEKEREQKQILFQKHNHKLQQLQTLFNQTKDPIKKQSLYLQI